jgi:MFS family permease
MSIVLVAVAIASLTYFVRHERTAEHPIIPSNFLRHRAIGPAIAATFLFGICFLALDVFVPLYIQGGRGGGAGAAAAVVTPVMLTWAMSGPIAAPLMVRWGFRNTSLVGAALIVVGFAGLLLGAIFHAPQWAITAILAITGLGFGPSSMGYLLSAQDAVDWQQRGGVTGTISFFRSIGGALGVGLMGALFNVLSLRDMDRFRAIGVTPGKLLDPRELGKLEPAVLQSVQGTIAWSLTWVFAAMLAVALLNVLVTALMPRRVKPDHTPKPSEALEVVTA